MVPLHNAGLGECKICVCAAYTYAGTCRKWKSCAALMRVAATLAERRGALGRGPAPLPAQGTMLCPGKWPAAWAATLMRARWVALT